MKTRLAPWLIAGLCMSLLTACSKTVTWEEEVPLNTGEVIWVERSVDYSIQGDAGNPMDLAWRPRKEQTLEFEWKGKRYRYEGDACLQVLAVHDGSPVLIADSQCYGWNWTHNYDKCVSHVQLNAILPSKWAWPPAPEEWIYGLKTNLVIDFSDRKRLLRKVVTDLREKYQTKDPQLKSLNELVKPSSDFTQRCKKEIQK
jgi:hypothetical protein